MSFGKLMWGLAFVIFLSVFMMSSLMGLIHYLATSDQRQDYRMAELGYVQQEVVVMDSMMEPKFVKMKWVKEGE